MLLPIKPICSSKKKRRNGTSIIFIQYCYSATNRTQLNTEIAIPPKFWQEKNLSISKSLPAEYGNADDLNEQLKQMLRSAEDLVTLAEKQGIQNKGAFVKQAFKPSLNVHDLAADIPAIQKLAVEEPKGMNVYTEMDAYKKSKEKKVSKATLTIIKNMKEHFIAFEKYRSKAIAFTSFDYAFYEEFVEFLTYDYVQPRRKEKTVGLKINSIGKTIRQFRTFIKDRVRRKIIAPIDITDFKTLEEETDAIYLTFDEIAMIYNTDLSAQTFLKEYRDLFVLACLTGLRFSDFSTLKPDDLRKNMLYKKQEKSDGWVVIPLRTEAKEIFTEQFRERIPDLTNAEFNRHIKTVGKLAGLSEQITFKYKKGNKDVVITKDKSEWITTHTARRSFCTNEFLAGTPPKLIMKISGHKKEANFYKYIRINSEEAALKIASLWLERGSMTAFQTGQRT